MIGFFERVYGLNAEGWAIEEQSRDRPIKLYAIDSSQEVVGEGRTQIQRPDVYNAMGYGLGSGFSIRIKKKCSPGRIRIVDANGNELPASDDVSAPELFPKRKTRDYVRPSAEKRLEIPVFIFAPIDWEIRFQRPQQLAVYLSKLGYKVFYMQPRLGFDPSGTSFDKTNVSENIFLVRICVKEASSTVLDLRPETSKEILKNLFQLGEFSSKSIEIIQHPLWHNLIYYNIEKRFSIFDFLDDVSGVKGEHGMNSLPYQNLLLENCNFVIASSVKLQRFAYKKNKNVFLAPNGASEIFSSTKRSLAESRDTALYVGAVEDWFDFDLVNSVMSDNESLKLIIVGSCSSVYRSKFQSINRIEFLGEVDHFALPQVMGRARVGLIPFVNNDFVKTIDAVKKYEYIMSGLPVVASGLESDLDFEGHFWVENDPKSFGVAVRKAMKMGRYGRIKGKFLARKKSWPHQLAIYKEILSAA